MSLSLPTGLKEYVKERVRLEHFGTPSDYIRGLIREDLKRSEEDRLERMLLAGLSSGEGESMSRGAWQKLRVAARAGKRKSR